MIHKCLWLAMFLTGTVIAEPEVIADFGGKNTGFVSPSERLRTIASEQSIPASATSQARPPMADRFPVESDMRVGLIDAHDHDKPVNRPFFILGYDQHSAEWLQENRNYLIEINARGLVTNVQSEQQMNVLREYGSGLTMDAIPVDSVAAVFGLAFYPVLVTKEEVTQ